MKLTEKNDKYTFTMPDSKVTVTAEFAEVKAASTFADVPADAYYAKAVAWAVENGVTNVTSASTFSPGSGCNPGPDRHLPLSRLSGQVKHRGWRVT